MSDNRVESWLAEAIARHQAGELAASETLYRRVLAEAPDSPDALHFLGLLLHQVGRSEAGLPAIRRSVELRPEYAGYRLNLGGVLEELGRLEEAGAAFEAAARLEPADPDIHFNAGLVQLALEEPERALASFRRVLELDPADARARLNLGRAFEAMGDWPAASSAYVEAAAQAPGLPAAQAGAGRAQMRLGNLGAAEQAYRRAAALAPDDASVQHGLGQTLRSAGRPRDALDALRRAHALDPERIAFAVSAARAALECGAPEEALRLARVALDRVGSRTGSPDRSALSDAHAAFASALAMMPPDAHDARLAEDYRRVWSDPDRDPQPTARALAGLLCARLGAAEARDEGIVPPAERASLERAAADPLLLTFLARGLNVDARLEGHLRCLRAGLLALGEDRPESPGDLSLAAAIGVQAFSNEYVWPVEPGAAELVDRLQARVGAALVAPGVAEALISEVRAAALDVPDGARLDPGSAQSGIGGAGSAGDQHADPDPGIGAALRFDLARVSMYRPLHALVSSGDTRPWLGVGTSTAARPGRPGEAPVDPWVELLRRTVSEPWQEEALRPDLESLGEIRDRTSTEVREQYEDNPYPRWTVMPDAPRRTLGETLALRFPSLVTTLGERGFERVLVAGCGTGYEPIMLAMGEPQASVTALDLSAASLAYAERMRRAHRIENLRFVQGDLLAVSSLEQECDLIVSTGVLHHMADPLAGWRALRGVLAPGGVMRISLYSERARRSVVSLRGTLETRGPDWSLDAMHRVRHRILSAVPSSPISALATSDDLFSVSAVRDLLFHTCEHRFTPARIDRCLDDLDLEFLGMEILDPGVAARFRVETGLDPRHAPLSAWEAFEGRHPDSFPGMLQFWCRAGAAGPARGATPGATADG